MKRIALLLILLFPVNTLAPPPKKLTVSWVQVTTYASGNSIPVGTIKNYRVFRSVSQNGPWTIIATTVNNTYLDSGLQPNRTYYYYITSLVNAVESNRSTVVSGRT